MEKKLKIKKISFFDRKQENQYMFKYTCLNKYSFFQQPNSLLLQFILFLYYITFLINIIYLIMLIFFNIIRNIFYDST